MKRRGVKRICLILMFWFFSIGSVCLLAGCSESNSGEYKPFTAVPSGDVDSLTDQTEPDSQPEIQPEKPAESQSADFEPVIARKPKSS